MFRLAEKKRPWLFAAALILIAAHDLIRPFQPTIRYLDEFFCLVLLFAILWKTVKKKFRVNWIFFTTLIFIVYAVILLLAERLPLSHLAQVFISMKYMIILSFFISLKNPASYEKIFRRWFIAVNAVTIVFIILQYLIGPPVYELFKITPQFRGAVLRHTGIFASPVFSATMLFTAIAFYSSRLAIHNRLSKLEWLLLLLSSAFLLTSLTRRYLLVTAMIMLHLTLLKRFYWKHFLLIGLSFLALASAPLIPQYLEQMEKPMNQLLHDPEYIRRVLLTNGFELAALKFPFGSGPGTFGSKYSVIHYSPYYFDFGMDQLFHFQVGQQHMSVYDVYLASILGEYGVTGIFLLIFVASRSLLLLWRGRHHPFVLFSFWLSVNLIIESVTQSLQTAHYGWIIFSAIGLGLNQATTRKECR